LVWGVAIGEDQAIHGGGGFNVRSTDQDNIVEDKSASTAGLYNTTFTAVGSTNWIAQLATFKPLVTLPITLLSFDARSLSSGTVELAWTTPAQFNGDHFEIQRSPNGQSWTTIGQTSATGGPGGNGRYSFVDDAPYGGTTCYRLKQIDRDGNATFSRILTTLTSQAITLHVYPNPTVSYLTVEGTTQPSSVFNTAGQRMSVRVNAESPTKHTLDLSSLPKGAYFVTTGDRATLVYKQ
jgi:hypothetical protein